MFVLWQSYHCRIILDILSQFHNISVVFTVRYPPAGSNAGKANFTSHSGKSQERVGTISRLFTPTLS